MSSTRREEEQTLDPSREEFHDLAEADEPVVVRLEAPLPVETRPLAAYAALKTDAPGFLLESAEKTASSDPDGAFRPANEGSARHARYSFVGYDPAVITTITGETQSVMINGDRRLGGLIEDAGDGDVLDKLRAVLPSIPRRGFPAQKRQQLAGGLVGFLGYESVYDCWLDDVGLSRPESSIPDAQFLLTTKTVVFDDVEETVNLVLTPVVFPEDDLDAVYDELTKEVDRVSSLMATAEEPDPNHSTIDRATAESQSAYEQAVETTKEHVLDGDIYQGVISRTRRFYGSVDPMAVYASLRSVNPSPYMYLLEYGERSIVGASPETLVSVGGDRVTVNPIAGTCRRGQSPVEDRRLAGEMLADEKELAEHTMLVDLARNDVRRVSRPGSVRVEEFMDVLKYSHVQHIESTVTGRLADELDAFDAIRATFPAGTLSGAPKIRAMEIIEALESTPRGIYGGGIGYISWSGDADFAIAIRSAAIDHTGDTDEVTVRAGAGIVADSDPTSEYEETEAKMDGVLVALESLVGDLPEAEEVDP